ncbi:hypothetical protein KI688_007788 [Linnemannia hyalina]|uniref:Uncharacterized protein n=1 Tax=Linnemannia hyalina TaxID=64524 RepID=A0A9P7XK66_9FUNG|nr:hypothetical protein KI688_007788 [Linnemannia hyalina]
MGREKTESFKEYELRLRRLVEVYRVKELPKHTDVTQTLRMSIPSLTLTVMQLSETVNMLLKHVGMAVPDVTSLDFLMNAIPNALGPDECSEWKVFIDASRKARMSKESDGINQGGSQHHRQHQQVKKTVAAQTNAGASSGSNTVSANNNHNSYPNGHQGQYPGNRGKKVELQPMGNYIDGTSTLFSRNNCNYGGNSDQAVYSHGKNSRYGRSQQHLAHPSPRH